LQPLVAPTWPADVVAGFATLFQQQQRLQLQQQQQQPMPPINVQIIRPPLQQQQVTDVVAAALRTLASLLERRG
jgi:hypothetical protein